MPAALRRPGLIGAVAVAALLASPLLLGTAPAGAQSLTSPATSPVAAVPGAFVAVTPSRILDTRQSAAIGARSAITLGVAGRAGVPATGVGAVEVSVVALTPTGNGTVTVAPGGSTATTSSLSYTTSRSVAGTIVSGLSTEGALTIRNNGGQSVQLVLDVDGYYLGGTPSAPGATVVTAPQRLADTRSGQDVRAGAVHGGTTVTLPVLGHAGIPASGVAAVLVNLTAVTPTATGSLTAFATGARPNVVSGSFLAGGSSSTLAQVMLGTDGAIEVGVNGTGSTQLVADIEGYVLSGSGTAAGVDTTITPARFLDTRSGIGTTAGAVRSSATFLVAGRGGVPSTGVSSAVVSLTVISPQAAGNLSVSADGSSPSVSTTVSFAPGNSYTALIIAPVGPDGRVLVKNNSPGTVQMVADVAGWVRSDPTAVTTSTSRYVRDLLVSNSDPANAAILRQHGSDDAAQAVAGAQYLSVLDLGAQFLDGSGYGVQLSATDTRLTDSRIETALKGYLDGFASARTSTAPVTIVIATNNDSATAIDSNAGRNWAGMINQLRAYASSQGWSGLDVVGGNDIEAGFRGTEAQAESWTKGYLVETSAPYVFLGSADGCPATGAAGGTCQYGWTAAQYYRLAHGLGPTQIFALPQIYVTAMAQQWKGIDLTGAAGADRITFLGPLTEYAACQQPGSGCGDSGYLTPAAARSALAAALASAAATSQQRLPVSTDLRIDNAAGASIAQRRASSAVPN